MEKKDCPPPPTYDDAITSQPQSSFQSMYPGQSPPDYAKDRPEITLPEGAVFTVPAHLQDLNFITRPEIQAYQEPVKETEAKTDRGCCRNAGKDNRNDCCMNSCECCFICCQALYICALCAQICAH